MRRIAPCIAVLVLSLVCAATSAADPLPNTAPLTAEGDLAAKMVEGIDRFLLAQTEGSILRREALWARDGSSVEAYRKSVEPNRKRLARILGVVEERTKFDAPELIATTRQSSLVGRSPAFEAHAIRWRVIGGIHGEGLLLTPIGKRPLADVVAIPDADQTPEQIAGLAPGVRSESQFARRLAEAGCRVIVPALVSRDDAYSMPPSGQKTNQPHREYVYRPAYEMGRHVIGYEVQKVLAAVDWFAMEADAAAASNDGQTWKIAVAGYGEGGMLALYAGAVDERIAVTAVSGYFGPRQGLWQEPIYRNLFGLLSEFGDAEIASLICPRALVIDKAAGPVIEGPPPPRDGRKGAAPGKLAAVDPADAGKEVARMHKLTDGRLPPFAFVVSPEDKTFMGDAVLEAVLRKLALQPLAEDGKIAPPQPLRQDFAIIAADRQRRMIDQMQEHTQQVVRDSEEVRKAFWSQADLKSRDPQKWKTSVEPYRKRFYDEVIGRFDDKLLPANPRTRQIYDEPTFTGYEVMLDVFPDVYAYGILLLPKGIKENERRPVVVCQHGLEGRPQDLADPKVDHRAYHAFAVRLAERGFVTFSPQNPYIGQDKFRTLQRKLNPLGKTLFSIIVPQHQQITDWLAAQPFVDPQRIGFYGLSYGGKTAMRVPPLVDRYCLSICSGDFNEWTWKNTSLTFRGGYPGTGEYEMFEWNLGNTFGYFEMTALIAPRPFMVERGHRDGVAPDEWVAYEYAKVRRLYADLKIPEKTEIEFFDGPHTIHGKGTYQFLHRHLNWPERKD